MTRRQQVVDTAALILLTVLCAGANLLGRIGLGPCARERR